MGQASFRSLGFTIMAIGVLSICKSAHSQSVPGFPKWDLSKLAQNGGDDGSYDLAEAFTLRPPDGRMPVNIASSVARQVLVGTMSPEVAYSGAGGVTVATGSVASTKGEEDYTYHSRNQIEQAQTLGSGLSSESTASSAPGASSMGSISLANGGTNAFSQNGNSGLIPAGGSDGSPSAIANGGAGAAGFKGGVLAGVSNSGRGLAGGVANSGNFGNKDLNSEASYGQRKVMDKDTGFMAGVGTSLNGAFGAGAAGVAGASGGHFQGTNVAPPPECVNANYKGTLCQGNTGQGNAAQTNWKGNGQNLAGPAKGFTFHP